MPERVESSLRVLRHVLDGPDPLSPVSVGVMARQMGTSTSTVSRIAAGLTTAGMLERTSSYGSYRIGHRATSLSGLAAAPYARAITFALTLMAQVTGETACIVADSPAGPRVIAAVQSVWTLHVAAPVGAVLDDPDGAVARALRIPRTGGPGASRTFESRSRGISETSTAVLGADGAAVAALSVRFPQERTTELTALAKRVLPAARQHVEAAVIRSDERRSRPETLVPAVRPDEAPISMAVRLLFLLASGGPSSTPDIAQLLGIRTDRASRLLEACVRNGLVREPDGSGLSHLEWNIHGWHRSTVEPILRGPGKDLVERTAASTGTTAYLTVRRGMGSYTIAEAISPGPLTMRSWLGRTCQIVSADGGPLLVMDFDDEDIRRVLPGRIRMTARHTPPDVTTFLREVRRARTRAVLAIKEFGENGLTSIAAPVHDASGAVAAAACLVGPTDRMRTRSEGLERAALALAGAVSRLLCAPVDSADAPHA